MTRLPQKDHFFQMLITVTLVFLSLGLSDVSNETNFVSDVVYCDKIDAISFLDDETLTETLKQSCSGVELSEEDKRRFAAMTGDKTAWLQTCSQEARINCAERFEEALLDLQNDIIERLQNPDEYGQMLQLACLNPENAEALQKALDGRVEALFLSACFMNQAQLEAYLTHAFEVPELRSMAILLAHVHHIELPSTHELSEKEKLLYQWTVSSKR